MAHISGLKLSGLFILALTISACQPQNNGGTVSAFSRLDGPVRISTPIRQLKPSCSDPRQIIGKKLTDCFDPAYLAATRNPVSIEQARAYFSGNTTRSYSTAHGTQVSYEAPDGSVHLWYPGNTMALKGEWRVVAKSSAMPEIMMPSGSRALSELDSQAYICYRYGANTYNPVTQVRGRVWQCQDATITIRTQIREKTAGDIFNLSSGQIPFVMEKENLSFSVLKKRAARSSK